MTKSQLQKYIDDCFLKIDNDIENNGHSMPMMLAKTSNSLLRLGMMLENYNQKNTKNKTLNKIVKESLKWN